MQAAKHVYVLINGFSLPPTYLPIYLPLHTLHQQQGTTPVGGFFHVTYPGHGPTPALPYLITATDMASELRHLLHVNDTSDVEVSVSYLPHQGRQWHIGFPSAFGRALMLKLNTSSLIGSNYTASVKETQVGR